MECYSADLQRMEIGAVNIISIILWIVSNLPSIIRLVKMIIDLINGIQDRRERRVATRELARAIKHAKITGDSAELRNLLVKLSRASGRG